MWLSLRREASTSRDGVVQDCAPRVVNTSTQSSIKLRARTARPPGGNPTKQENPLLQERIGSLDTFTIRMQPTERSAWRAQHDCVRASRGDRPDVQVKTAYDTLLTMMDATVKTLDQLPHAEGRIPVLGDVTSVNRQTPTQHELKLSRQLGPIFQRKLLGNQLVLVAGSELANQCVDEASWARALAGPGEKVRTVAENGLFTARTSDPLWSHARGVLTPGFTQEAMRLHHTAMLSVAEDLSAEWSTSSTVDVHDAMTRTTLEVIARAGFSASLGLFAGESGIDGGADFIDALSRTLAWASESTNDLPVVGPIRSRLGRGQRERDIRLLRSVVDDVVSQRTAGHTTARGGDLLQLMLDESPESRLPLENVRNQILTFLVAGHETTASLLETALHYIARDTRLQERVKNEAATARRSGFAYDTVASLKDIRAVLNECLRLWPPLPGLFRVARKDQNVGGFLIPQGKMILLLTLAAQRDPAAWGADSDAFNPFRAKPARDAFFRPWGVGPRSCIGRAFALHESTLLVAHIVSSFELTLSENVEPQFQERGSLRSIPYRMSVSTR